MNNLNEQWENGTLGRDEAFVEVSPNTHDDLDELLGMQAISIRMPKSLIKDLKDISKLNGLGYQPLIKQILTRFVDGEKKKIANDQIQEKLSQMKACEEDKSLLKAA